MVVMQVQMPFQRAVVTLEALRAFPPKVVIVTIFESPRYVRDLTRAGASAYLLKTSSAEHLVAAVHTAVFDRKGKNTVVGLPPAMLEESGEGVEGVLSARELEILLLAARGLSNHQICLGNAPCVQRAIYIILVPTRLLLPRVPDYQLEAFRFPQFAGTLGARSAGLEPAAF